MRAPGKAVIGLGPSGSGKSHMLRTALEEEGSGFVVCALGTDELESYRDLYSDADIISTPEDVQRLVEEDGDGKARLVSEKPYLLACFDDEDFFPSQREWTVTGHASVINFLKLVRARLREALSAGEEIPWKVAGLDSFSGVGELASNAMLSQLRVNAPPKARGDGGAEYYIGYHNCLAEVARGFRSIRGYGPHWIATCHVQVKEASEAFSAQDVTANEQQMPMFTGQFRERVPSFFDLVGYLGVDKAGEHYFQPQPDRKRNSKSRYALDPGKLDSKGRLGNDWRSINDAIVQK